jgi:lysozyme family protein
VEWNTVLTHLLELEGGFTNDPADPGNQLPDGRPGCTNLGVTQRAWEEYIGRKVTHDEMRALTRTDVDPFYRALYWDSVRADELPALIRYAVFDAGVNSGPGTAIRWLQQAVGATPDGVLGPKTLAAIHELNHDATLRRMLAKRLTAMTSMSGWPSFSRGWARRIATLLEA